jgi:dTDP-4-dehydrorhamnose reductase
MITLVTGAKGQLGQTFKEYLGLENVVYADRGICDLSDKTSISECLGRVKPNRIINCAAYTAVDNAEDEPELANVVNGHAVGRICDWAKKYDAEVIHFSTDYVFDGTKSEAYLEEDKPNPQSVYGKSKLLGEELFFSSGARGICLRTSWVHSNYGKNFYRTMRKFIAEREELGVVDDQFGVPTTCNFIARNTLKLIDENKLQNGGPKIIHCTPSGSANWFEFATIILENLKKRNAEIRCRDIKPIPSKEYPQKATRPKNSVLRNSNLSASLDAELEDWCEEHEQLYA